MKKRTVPEYGHLLMATRFTRVALEQIEQQKARSFENQQRRAAALDLLRKAMLALESYQVMNDLHPFKCDEELDVSA